VQYASAKTLTILFRLFRYVLRTMSTSLILGLTALDLLAEILMKGLYRAKELGEQIVTLLGYAATWAGIKVAAGANFSAEIIRLILGKMMATLRQLSVLAMASAAREIVPLPLLLGSAWLLSSYGPL
jgi:hypothetical protein